MVLMQEHALQKSMCIIGMLIKALGFDESFKVCESLQEIGHRGGGWLAKELLKAYNKQQEE